MSRYKNRRKESNVPELLALAGFWMGGIGFFGIMMVLSAAPTSDPIVSAIALVAISLFAGSLIPLCAALIVHHSR